MADTIATSFGVLNYSGLLFNKGNTRTPLSSIIGGRAKITNHVEFVTGQEYTAGGDGSQPEISETASLTAPDASVVTREQKTNVTQIFMESVGISYAKQSNMGTLSGLNVVQQQENPVNELDFHRVHLHQRRVQQGHHGRYRQQDPWSDPRHHHQCQGYEVQAAGPVGHCRHGEDDLRCQRSHRWPVPVV